MKWLVQKSETMKGFYRILSDTGLDYINSVALVEKQEDANLIASAPEMYEVLQELLGSTDLNLDEGIDETTAIAIVKAHKILNKVNRK